MARANFDGTWRPDPQRPGPDAPLTELLITGDTYACRSCDPPYEVPIDGRDHPVTGQGQFDSLAISIVDARTVRRVARRGGQLVVDAMATLEADAGTRTERQLIADQGPRPYRVVTTSRRVGDAPPGSHPLSGSWQVVEMDLPDHDEDTTYRMADGTLTMADGFGRSFEASLDGTPAPYHGDPRSTSVSVRWLDDRTIEETDYRDGDAVLVMRWRVEPNGETMHVRFDDLRGHVMEQFGHRLP